MNIWKEDKKFYPFVLSLSILLGILIVFGKTIKYPYVQDDWFHLYEVANESTLDVIKNAFSPLANFHYRPFNDLFFLISYNLFGLSSLGYHLIFLFFHFCNALLVVYIVQKIDRSPLISWLAGLFYGIAIPIHLEPLIWAVGIQAIGCAFFFLSSFVLYLNNRYKLSSLSFFFSLLFQEGAVFLPALLFLYILLYETRWVSLAQVLKQTFSKIWLHCVLFSVYIAFKIQGTLYTSLPESQAYKIKFIGSHLLRNLIFYIKWSIDAILPWKDLIIGTRNPFQWRIELSHFLSPLFLFIIFTIAAILALVIFLLMKKADTLKIKNLTFWCIWFFLGLTPVIFLPNHIFRYYLTYSLPALIVLFLSGLRTTAQFLRCKEHHFAIIMIIYAIITTFSSAYFFGKCDSEGINHDYIGGDNNLLKKGSIVKVVWNGLLKAHPTLPPNAMLVFENIKDLWIFGFSEGPRLWYEDNTIMACKKEFLKIDQNGIYIDDPLWIKGTLPYKLPKLPDRVYIDPKRTFVFSLQTDGMRELNFSSLYVY